MTEQSITVFVEKLWSVATVWNPINVSRVVSNDPDDDHIIACALTAKAEFIVTGDKKHLLVLKEHQGIHIITPKEFVRISERR